MINLIIILELSNCFIKLKIIRKKFSCHDYGRAHDHGLVLAF